RCTIFRLILSSLATPFFVSSLLHHRDLHSFPTRRSSDLITGSGSALSENYAVVYWPGNLKMEFDSAVEVTGFEVTNSTLTYLMRSEEHTSELQSRENLVCRLLLEKKNENIKQESNKPRPA